MRRPSTKLLLCLGVFGAVFALHAFIGKSQVADSRWSIYTALSIVREGNTDLNEYEDVLRLNGNYAIEHFNGHAYTQFPVGSSILAVPFVFAIDRAGVDIMSGTDAGYASSQRIPAGIEKMIAAFYTAVTAVFIFLIARRFMGDAPSLLLTFIFAFCTSAWSIGSSGLWQHGPSMLMLAIALYLLLKARDKPRTIIYVSAPLAFSFVVRPTNAISIVVLSAYVFIRYRRYFVDYLLVALPVVVPFLAFNLLTYGALLSPYYMAGRIGESLGTFPEAFLGNIVSPARGLLVFSPVFLLAPVGVWLKRRQKEMDALDYYLLAIVCLHWIVISTIREWWVGYSYGPRLFSDMVPYLVYFLIPCVRLMAGATGRRRAAMVAVCALLVLPAFFVNLQGATSADAINWNTYPDDVNQNPSRVWDWSDPPWLRGW
ncbi:MAG: hypothetical protein ACYCXF_05560 [Thermoleophilia bacterium]